MASSFANMVALKLAVWVFSPSSPNSLRRAALTGLAMSAAPVAVIVGFGLVTPSLALAGWLLAPVVVLAILKVVYSMSFLRAFAVASFLAATLFVLNGLLFHRSISEFRAGGGAVSSPET